ncbi:GntR family transcriptional regulator [Marinibacterium profundimaris]|uniref:Transcriptional regulator n=1 Tax=Marinibacterium profundimaris TaxID=1679460 RepID=A0A225NGZ6_9RHOB|nr:GntR family transcriptional regulator [Marinibacterium profundimaris]OWU69902.1 transcriptional regulator [Marinibacterium profundimaris]
MARRPNNTNGSTPHTSVRQTGYELFQDALLDGRLKPGQLVSQRDLVDLLNLSIGALRELLPRLQAEGLVVVMPQRGIQILSIDLPMIRDAFQMRAALEREAVLFAVRRMPDETLAAQRELHETILTEIRTAPSDDSLQRGQDIDSGFHQALIQATGNELMMQAYNINFIRIRLIKLDRIRLNRDILPTAFAEHFAIIEGILSRDPVTAMQAMDAHIAHARDRAMEL